jgi:hypothetical protein
MVTTYWISVARITFGLLVGWLLVAVCISTPVSGEEETESFLPEEGIVLWRLQPFNISQANFLKLLPLEPLAALSSDALGIDLSRCSIAAGTVSVAEDLRWELAIRFSPYQNTDIRFLKSSQFGPIRTTQSNPGIRLREWKNTGLSVLQDNEQWLAGTEKSLKTMLSQDSRPHRLISSLQNRKEAIAIALDMKTLAPKLSKILKVFEISPFSEEAVLASECCSLLDHVECAIDIGSTTKVQIRWVAKVDADIEKCGDVVKKVLRRCGDLLVVQISRNFDYSVGTNGANGEALDAYFGRMKNALNDLVTTKIQQGEVVTELVEIEEVLSLLVVAMTSLQISDELGDFLPQPQTEQNMEMLIDALHSYETVHRRIPPRTVKDANGKPLLSWRVLLLPFVGEEELYSQFRLDEPWDSEHNKKLVDQMPSVFANQNADAPVGYTCYLAPHGFMDRREQTIWDAEPLLLRQVNDGLANTAAMVEVEPQSAVPWTKPEDFDLRERDLLEHWGAPPAGGLIVMLDTTCYDFTRLKEKKKLKAVLTANGGEAVNAPF